MRASSTAIPDACAHADRLPFHFATVVAATVHSQFRRAVEIVQGLPKQGPIQTGYEEKLAMYRCVRARRLQPA